MEGDDIGIKSFQTEFENCIYEINVFYQKNGANEGIINIEIEKKNEDCKFKNLQINYDEKKLEEDCKYQIEKKEEANEYHYYLKINEKEKFLIHPLNVKYYLTTGQFHSKQDSAPSFSYLEKKKFNIEDVLNLAKREKINELYCKNISGIKIKREIYFEKMKRDVQYTNDGKSPIIFEFNYNKFEETENLKHLKKSEADFSRQILTLNSIVNKKSMNSLKYDLIYLFASPIDKESISYREEIKILLDLLKKKGKKFNCLFECIGQKMFNDTLIKKKTKILHISSHGKLDKDEKYFIAFENLDECGKSQKIEEYILEAQLRKVSSKLSDIDLVILSTCHSGGLAKLFLKYGAKNVIYIHEKWEIADLTSIKFTEYFYSKLIDGYSIKESFDKAIKELKSDKEILFYNPNKCCCNHFHSESCQKICFCKYNKKNEIKCNCKFEQNHRHDMNDKVCNLYEKIYSKNRTETKIYENERNNYRLMCCCDVGIPHNEIDKIILHINEKSNQYPFRYIEDGELTINENIKFDFNPIKNRAIIGRKKIISDIFGSIQKGNHFLIVYGKSGLKKRDFVESLCVYLYERKIIEDYILFFREEMDYDDIKEKIKKRASKKTIISIRIDQIEQSNINDNIDKIEKEFSKFKNLYFIFILDKSEKKDINTNFELKPFDLKIKDITAKNIMKEIFKFYGRSVHEEMIDSILNEFKKNLARDNQDYEYDYETITKLVDSYAFPNKKLEDSKIQKGQEKLEDFKIQKESEKLLISDKPEVFFLLKKMPYGLPESFLSLIFDQFDQFKDKLKINRDIKNKWYNIIKFPLDIKENNDKFEKECFIYFLKALKIYTQILFCNIEENRENINFPDENIHLIFNSYNGEGIWKSNIDEEIQDEDPSEFLKNEDFNIQKHKENILHLIRFIIQRLHFFNKVKNKEERFKKYHNYIKYLEEILLLFPSYFFLKKSCKECTKKCLDLCEKCIDFFTYKEFDREVREKFRKLKAKLSLFLYSIDDSEKIELNDFPKDVNYKLELQILKLLKNKSNELETILINDNGIPPEKKSILFYELAVYYYTKKEEKDKGDSNLEKAIRYLEKARDNSEENTFLKSRIIIDSYYILKYQINFKNKLIERNEIEEIIQQLESVMDENYNSKLFREASHLKNEFNNLLKPHIVMLNSNPIKSRYSLLSSGIEAYPNNQFYILEKLNSLSKNKEIKSYKIIKSDILNLETLQKAIIGLEGILREILIIQSDDFTANGDLVLESEFGISETLTKKEFIDKICNNENIKSHGIQYKIIILSFINSSKFVEYLVKNKVKYQYLIYFDIPQKNKNKSLIEYNQLFIENIIEFIKLYSDKDFIFDKNILKEKFGDVFNIIEKDTSNLRDNIIEIDQGKAGVNIMNPLPDLSQVNKLLINEQVKLKDYSIKMFNIINTIKKGLGLIFYCDKNKKQKYLKIGMDIIKFFHRHKEFYQYNCINMKDEENKIELKDNEFYFIYNCKKLFFTEMNLTSQLTKNNGYMIIYDREEKYGETINPDKLVIQTPKQIQRNSEDFSIFNFTSKSYDSEPESFDEDNDN